MVGWHNYSRSDNAPAEKMMLMRAKGASLAWVALESGSAPYAMPLQ
jgi:hypothetical protein